MVGAFIKPVIAALGTMVMAFVVGLTVFYVAGGPEGARQFTQQAIEFASLLVSGVVNLLQAVFRAAMGAIQ